MTQKQLDKYKNYLSSKYTQENEPAISVSDRGVVHVSSSYVLGTNTGREQVDASIRLKKSAKKSS